MRLSERKRDPSTRYARTGYRQRPFGCAQGSASQTLGFGFTPAMRLYFCATTASFALLNSGRVELDPPHVFTSSA
jgi:hypothetical protein